MNNRITGINHVMLSFVFFLLYTSADYIVSHAIIARLDNIDYILLI